MSGWSPTRTAAPSDNKPRKREPQKDAADDIRESLPGAESARGATSTAPSAEPAPEVLRVGAGHRPPFQGRASFRRPNGLDLRDSAGAEAPDENAVQGTLGSSAGQ